MRTDLTIQFGCLNERLRPAPAKQVWSRCGWLLACWLACCATLISAQSAAAQQNAEEGFVSREYPLKALFLYNFGGYIEWPPGTFANDQAPFVIGILGSTSIEETLNQIAASKQLLGRKIVVQRFDSANNLRPCQILFIARTVSPQQQRLAIQSLADRPVLIVGESDGFAVDGGCINFFISANNIRFEINLTAMKRQQLKVSSKLLAMARIVESESGKR